MIPAVITTSTQRERCQIRTRSLTDAASLVTPRKVKSRLVATLPGVSVRRAGSNVIGGRLLKIIFGSRYLRQTHYRRIWRSKSASKSMHLSNSIQKCFVKITNNINGLRRQLHVLHLDENPLSAFRCCPHAEDEAIYDRNSSALHRRIKIQCAIDDTKMTDVMRVLLEREFDRQERQDGSARTTKPKQSAGAL